MTEEVVSLAAKRADKFNNNSLISPGDCLLDAKQAIEGGKRKCNKVLVITLNDVDQAYDVGWFASDLSCSQMLALCEVMKARILSSMGYVQEP